MTVRTYQVISVGYAGPVFLGVLAYRLQRIGYSADNKPTKRRYTMETTKAIINWTAAGLGILTALGMIGGCVYGIATNAPPIMMLAPVVFGGLAGLIWG